MFCQFRHLRTWLVHHWMTGSLTSRVTIKAAGRTLSTPAYTEGDLLCSALLPPPLRDAMQFMRGLILLARLLRESSAALSRETVRITCIRSLGLLQVWA